MWADLLIRAPSLLCDRMHETREKLCCCYYEVRAVLWYQADIGEDEKDCILQLSSSFWTDDSRISLMLIFRAGYLDNHILPGLEWFRVSFRLFHKHMSVYQTSFWSFLTYRKFDLVAKLSPGLYFDESSSFGAPANLIPHLISCQRRFFRGPTITLRGQCPIRWK